MWRGPRAAAWCGVALLLALPSLALPWVALDASAPYPQQALIWLQAHAWDQPWRWWTAAWVHGSAQHLSANLAACAAVACLGVAARMPVLAAAAWLLAWPFVQMALVVEPRLLAYGGASGVLHAGVAVCGVVLLLGHGRDGHARPDHEGEQTQPVQPVAPRWLGAALLVGLAGKLIHEAAWTTPLVHRDGWGLVVAPVAHLTGALFGALAGGCTAGAARLPRSGRQGQ